MALTILQEPSEISFSRNPLWFQFQTDNLYSQLGRPSIYIFDFPSSRPTGGTSTLTITYGLIGQVFAFKAIPNDSGLQLHDGGNGISISNWIDQLILDFKGNFFLDRDYIITKELSQAEPRIKFQAKKYDPIYDITIENYTGIFGPVSLSTVLTGLKKAKQVNFKLFFEIWVENAAHTAFNLVQGELFADVDDSGLANINLSQTITQSLLADGSERPDFNQPAGIVNKKTCRRYYIRYAEAFGSNQAVKKLKTSAIKWAILGGVSKAKQTGYVLADNFLINNYHLFLKQEALSKNVKLNQPECLSMIWLTTPPAAVNLRVKVYFTVGAPAEFDTFVFNGLAKYDKITIPSGATQLNLSGLYPDKIITQYQVWVEDAANARLTEIRTYILDYQVQTSARFFTYLSSLGTYDTFFTYGKGAKGYDILTQKAEISKSIDFQFADGDTLDFDTTIEDKETVLSGWVNKRELKRFRDFFLSWDKHQVRNLISYPVEVDTKSIKELKEDDNLFAITFETGYRFSERLWTEDLEDTSPTSPIDVSAFLPAVAVENPANFDNLYYRKTQTYNQAEINSFINSVLSQEQIHHASQQGLIDGLLTAIQNKANVNHTHQGLYATPAELEALAVNLTPVEIDVNASGIKVINWQTDQVSPGRTYANRFGNGLFKYQAYWLNGSTYEPFTSPMVQVVRELGAIITVTITTAEQAIKIII